MLPILCTSFTSPRNLGYKLHSFHLSPQSWPNLSIPYSSCTFKAITTLRRALLHSPICFRTHFTTLIQEEHMKCHQKSYKIDLNDLTAGGILKVVFEGAEVFMFRRVNGHFKFAPTNLEAETGYIKFNTIENINYIQLLSLIINPIIRSTT